MHSQLTHNLSATPPEADWHPHAIAAYLGSIAVATTPADLARLAVERTALALAADVCAVVENGVVLHCIGYGRGAVPEADIVAAAQTQSARVQIPGFGSQPAISAGDRSSGGVQLVIARASPAGFGAPELAVLESMAFGAALALRDLRPQPPSEIRPAELRESAERVSLERYEARGRLLRAVLDFHERLDLGGERDAILAEIAEAACKLTGADVAIVRIFEPDGVAALAAVCGGDPALLNEHDSPALDKGLGRLAVEAKAPITIAHPDAAEAEAEFVTTGIRAAMVAPIDVDGIIVGTLALGSRASIEAFDPAAEDAVFAFSTAVGSALASRPTSATAEVTAAPPLDPLTSLPGRDFFIERVERAMTREDASPAVLLIDLDGFRLVNDSLGPDAGDRLLRAVARRFGDVLRPSDTFARFGSDEFAVLIEALPGTSEGPHIAGRLLSSLSEQFRISDRELSVSASIGVGVGGEDASAMIHAAALALDSARTGGGDRYETFDPTMRVAAVKRFDMELDLARAIERDELVAHYQPIFDLNTLEPVAFEALMRWRHPQRGLVPPDAFIPTAERTGLINPMGRWIMRGACRQLAAWRERYPERSDLRVCVNVSPGQLGSGDDLMRDVETTLAQTGLDPAALTLEITETTLMKDTAANVDRLAALKGLGVNIAVDDFGVGYSSLRYLSNFPIDTLKIDRSFVTPADDQGEDEWTVLQTIVELAKRLGLSVVAEGIEDALAPRRLLELGCVLGQGILLCPAAPAGDIDALLRRSPRGVAGGTPVDRVDYQPG